MSNRFLARTVMASLLALLEMTLGCGESSPTGPSQQTIPSIPPAFVTFVSPHTGSTAGGTRVTISGSGFQSGATVTLDGAATNVSVVSSTAITAITSAHAAGTVDVVVTTPDGQSGRLTGGYTYAVFLPLSITAVSPTTGSTGGSTTVTITGTGFQPGATVTLDGVAPGYVWVRNSTTLQFWTPAHADGTVDVVVTNPGGQADTLRRGYTYASPLSFDFNGSWGGGAGPEGDVPFRFTIQNNVLVNVSCGTSGTFTFSPPPAVSNGEFSFLGNDGVAVSGRIVAASAAVGMINMAPCTATGWWAERNQGARVAAFR